MKKFFLLAIPSILCIASSCSFGGSSDLKVEYFPVQEDDEKKWGLLGLDGELLLSEEFTYAPSPVVNGLFSVRGENGFFTLYEASKKPKEILEDLVEVGFLVNNRIPVVKKSERIGVVNSKGEPQFNLEPVNGKEIIKSSSFFTEGLLVAVNEDNLYGAFNEKGEVAVDFKYNEIGPFHDGMAIAIKSIGDNESKTIVIDKKGNEIDNINIKEGYTLVKAEFNDGFLAIKDREGTFRFINKKGEEIKLPGKVKNIGEWNSKYFTFQGDDGWGLMTLDESSEVVIKAKYSNLIFLTDKKLMALDNKDTYILNDKGDKEVELSEDYQNYTFIPDAKFSFIATERSHYVILNEQGKPFNKLELASIDMDLNINFLESNFFDVTGFVQNLVANITDKGIGSYYIGEEVTKLKLDPQNFIYTSSFPLEDIDFNGYKYSISGEGEADTRISVGDYDFLNHNYVYTLNPDAKIEELNLIARMEQNCWVEAKPKLFEAIKAKGYKLESENEDEGYFTNGDLSLKVSGEYADYISITIKNKNSSSNKSINNTIQSGVFPNVGTFTGKIDGKTDIVLEVSSYNGTTFSGNAYYPNTVSKYGKNNDTLMPFTGRVEKDDFDTVIYLTMTLNNNPNYKEQWTLFTQDGVAGTIRTSTGKEWEVRLND